MDNPLIYSSGTRKCAFFLTQPDEDAESVESETGNDHYHALIDKSKFSVAELNKFPHGKIDNNKEDMLSSIEYIPVISKKRGKK